VRFPAALSMLGLLCVQPAAAKDPSKIPEENYDFLSVIDGPCVPKLGYEPKDGPECGGWTGQRRYRGTWRVEFEDSSFVPRGMADCAKTMAPCPLLAGKALPWPSRWACPRRFEVEFIGRRNRLPGWMDGSRYEIVVDTLISAKRLPDPPHEQDECDPNAP